MNFQRLSPEELILRLAALVDSSEDAIIGTDAEGMINSWNSAARELFGYGESEIVGESILLLVPPDLHDEQHRNFESLRQGKRVSSYETQRLRKGGGRVDLSMTLSPIRDAQGNFLGSAVIARDLSAHRTEARERARLAAIVESSDDAIVGKDLTGVVTDWNSAAERLFGYTADEMIGRSILTIIPPDLQSEEPVILAKIRNGERVEHLETQRMHKSGRRIEVSLSMSPIRDGMGRIIGVSKIARGITNQRKLESARLFLASIVESSDDAIVSKSLDGIITSWNAAAERLFGYKPEEIIGESVLRLIPPELHNEEPGIIARLKRGERIEHHETKRRRKDGEVIDVSLTVSPIRDERGTVIGGSKILRDIRDRKAAEAALVEKEKYAAAGRLAATLAHEVNNPLEAITNLSYLLAQNASLDEEARRYADLLLQEVQRAGQITRQTLGYYRQSASLTEVDIEQVVQHVLHAKRKKVDSKDLRVDVSFPEDAKIQGSAGELRQVFDNLVENAIDAAPLEGRLMIRARLEGGELSVTVADNGPGIPEELLPRIFEPFFTTKAEKGSGLGLWVCRSIVEKFGGKIQAENRRDSASETAFTVTLPIDGKGSKRKPRKDAAKLAATPGKVGV